MKIRENKQFTRTLKINKQNIKKNINYHYFFFPTIFLTETETDGFTASVFAEELAFLFSRLDFVGGRA
jgi:hypothetical protein